MLIGIINKGYEQIHIKEDNGKVSFIKVNDKVNTLNKAEALDILKDIFNTSNLKYIESNNDYDIYLDLANNKRYFKNGIEDFRMFYDNNGNSNILYSKGGKNTLQKTFAVATISGLLTTLILTNEGINNYIVKYLNTNASDKNTIVETIDNNESSTIDNSEITDVISEEPYIDSYVDTVYEIENYINESNGLTDTEKQVLNNTDYFDFLLSITDISSKLYDFNERMTDINSKTFNEETNLASADAEGYYIYGTNSIYIREDCVEDIKLYTDVATHEFIHLTQVSTNYKYIKEALAEIFSREFYDAPINSYLDCVSNVKMLIEVIGPDAVANAAFSHDTTKFEDAVKQYLSEEDANKFFELLNSSDIYDYEKSIELNKSIKSYIKTMLARKENNDETQIALIEYAASKQNNNTKFYFNSNREEYYSEIQYAKYDNNSDYKVDNIKNYLLTSGTPNNIEIFSLTLDKQQFLNNFSEIKKVYCDLNIQNQIVAIEPLDIINYEDDEGLRDNDNIEYSGSDYEYYNLVLTLDEKGNYLNKGEPISDEELINLINTYDKLDFTLFLYLSYTWDEFNSNPLKFIYDKQYEADVHYIDGKTITVNNTYISEIILETVSLPSISDRFEIEYLNKGKSK